MVIACCLAASFLNAVAAVLQRHAAGNPKSYHLFRRHFIMRLLKSRVWQTGMALQVVSGFLSVVALWKGSLVLVEPILTSDLVFLMLILHFYLRFKTGLREWSGVIAICAGLSILLIAAEPNDTGISMNNEYLWVIISTAIAAAIVVSAAIMRSAPSSHVRAGVGGVASGLNLALSASLLKLAFHQWTFGIGNVVSHWEFYVLLVSAAASVIVLQSTFAAGSLVISQPAIEITTPLVSAALGIFLLDETINTGAVSLIFEIFGALVAGGGIILMGGSKRIQSQRQQSKRQPQAAAL